MLFVPEFNFASTGLTLVTLGLDVPKMTEAAQGSLEALVEISATSIHDALVTEYGQPTEKTGICNEVTGHKLIYDRGPFECHAKWKADGQLVKETWAYYAKYPTKEKHFYYFLEYHAEISGL